MMDDVAFDRARRLALTVLADSQYPTPGDVMQAVHAAAAAAGILGHAVDTDELRRRIEADVSVYVGQGAVLDDPDANHRPWLNTRRTDIEWRFWNAYKLWAGGRYPPEVVRGLDRLTDEILDRLEDPRRGGPWDRRGMVVGQVQSGKTANYTALICKAADAGYKFIVILAGTHNSLRSQTQHRLDEGFLGLDSRTSLAFANTNRAIGVGSGGRHHPPAYTLTSSDERGDFAKGVAGRVAGRIGSDPVLLVVKKHKTILHNLIEWVTSINGVRDPETGRRVVSNFPILVIDDEADYASVNTRKIIFERDDEGSIVGETDPTEINKQIRTLLFSFTRCALVSYTATPFANIFIAEEDPSPSYGEDLFPRSFILRVPPPTNYVGPAEVFGVPAAEDPEGVERPGLPVLRTVRDNEAWLPTGHKRTVTPGKLPESLREAIRAFLLVCAARAARGQASAHNSMLVHVTRFVDVQHVVRDQVEQELDTLRDRIEGLEGEGGSTDDLRSLWETDFEPTFDRMPDDLRGKPVRLSDVAPHLAVTAARITVLEINGTARDALMYSDHPEGRSIIAVGGDKLSRGLTLEGLSVSYYLRASKMYDTLMQMGRWFGYRDGYNDLIRLYTTAELQAWYRDLTIANEELGAKFDEMALVGSNPRDFSLYVRKSSAGLLVTAQAKMRSGRTMELTFSGDVVETIGFRRDKTVQDANLKNVENFLDTHTGNYVGDAPHYTWVDVPGSDVATMLEDFRTVDEAKKARGRLLAQYIRSRIAHSELTGWTVVMINNRQTLEERISLAEIRIGLTTRRYFKASSDRDTEIDGDFTIRRLGDPNHELLDLDEGERRQLDLLRAASQHEAERLAARQGVDLSTIKPLARGPFARKVRPLKRGLIVLYCLNPEPAKIPGALRAIPAFLVSFPESPGAPTVRYVVPARYWEWEAA